MAAFGHFIDIVICGKSRKQTALDFTLLWGTLWTDIIFLYKLDFLKWPLYYYQYLVGHDAMYLVTSFEAWRHISEDIRGHGSRFENSILAYCHCLFHALALVQLLYRFYAKQQNSLQDWSGIDIVPATNWLNLLLKPDSNYIPPARVCIWTNKMPVPYVRHIPDAMYSLKVAPEDGII